MLRTRVLTALVLLLVLAAAAMVSLMALLGLGAIFMGVALYEWLLLSDVARPCARTAAAVTTAAALALEAAAWAPSPAVLAALCALACGAWLLIALLLARIERGWGSGLDGRVHIAPALLVGAAVLLTGAAWFSLSALLHHGALWTLSVLALVWLADSAAYFTGRAFGRSKLAVRISPGKTWAGVWGALATVLAVAEFLRWGWPGLDTWSTRLLQAAPVAGLLVLVAAVAASIAGDLFESLVKRQAGVKDSGWILPGHGGVWDRIDASLPVLPLAVLSHWLLAGGWSRG